MELRMKKNSLDLALLLEAKEFCLIGITLVKWSSRLQPRALLI